MRNKWIRVALFAVAWLSGGLCSAQQYPTKPIRFVIGFPPGTTMDGVARPLAGEMEKRLGQPIVFDYKPGANATIAAKSIVNAPPDGYALYFGGSVSISPILMRNNFVNAGKDLTPVSRVATLPYFLVSRASLSAASFKELVSYAKTNPGKLTHGSPAVTADLMMQLLGEKTGVLARGIPYKGSPPILAAMLSGDVDLAISSVQAFLPLINDGRLRALFVTSPARSSILPNVPTAAEAGAANFEPAFDYELWAPPATAREIVQRLRTEVAASLAVASVAEQIRKGAGADPVGSTPEELMRVFQSRMRFWEEAARVAKFQPQ